MEANKLLHELELLMLKPYTYIHRSRKVSSYSLVGNYEEEEVESSYLANLLKSRYSTSDTTTI